MVVPVLWTTSLEDSLVDGAMYGSHSKVVVDITNVID
jgi:hypothetical protein